MVSMWILLGALATISLNSLNCAARNDESYLQYKVISENRCYQHGRQVCTGWWLGRGCRTEYYCSYNWVTRIIQETKYRCKEGWTPYPNCSTPTCLEACDTGFNCTAPNNCTDINECVLEQHQCQHDCVNTPGGHKCDCKLGYALNPDNKTCSDVDECSGANDCQGTCVNIEGSYTCNCSSGFTLTEDGKSCLDIDECADNKTSLCHHVCSNTLGSYKCDCEENYELTSDGVTCKAICEPACNVGYDCTAPNVCRDIDECALDKCLCQHKCVNIEGSYKCQCNTGFQLNQDGRTCEDFDECSAETADCSEGCQNTIGSFRCTCSPGHLLKDDGKTCFDVDECAYKASNCMQKCTNTDGSYTCECLNGYRIAPDMHSCIDINECETKNGGCEHDCTNTEGSFTCSCRSGFKLNLDQLTCSGHTIDETTVDANTETINKRKDHRLPEIEQFQRLLEALFRG